MRFGIAIITARFFRIIVINNERWWVFLEYYLVKEDTDNFERFFETTQPP